MTGKRGRGLYFFPLSAAGIQGIVNVPRYVAIDNDMQARCGPPGR